MTRAVRLLLLAPVVALACADVSTANRARATWAGTLSVDIRGSVDVSIAQTSAEDADVKLAFDGPYGLVDTSRPLAGPGKIERFPEAPGWEMYTARFVSAPVPGGPCGAQPVSLAMSLVRRDGNARVSGAVTAYCGSAVYAGIPARVLRLAGKT